MRIHNTFREKAIDVLEAQLKDNNPPEAKATLERMVDMGFEDHEAKALMVKCLIIELLDALNNNNFFNEKRYIKNLNKLPENPEDINQNKNEI